MNSWLNPRTDEWHDFDTPTPEVWVSENPIIGQLFAPDGSVLLDVHESPPRRVGYRAE